MIEKLAIIGVGLIGGSLALALREAGHCRFVTGVGRNPDNLDIALRRGIIDRAEQDIPAAVSDADMVVLSVPVGAVGQVARQLKGRLKPGAVVTDVGSVKGDIVEQVGEAFGGLPPSFVPGHPIAGTENSGAEAALAGLFRHRRVILTPVEVTSEAAVQQVREMWTAAGAKVECMDVHHHDRVLALTSHLPHMLAFGLVDSLARQQSSEAIFRYAAGGFRDFTRIASSDPVMWRDICLHNRDAILAALDDYQQDLSELRKAIEAGDSALLEGIFSRAKQARDQHIIDSEKD